MSSWLIHLFSFRLKSEPRWKFKQKRRTGLYYLGVYITVGHYAQQYITCPGICPDIFAQGGSKNFRYKRINSMK